MPIINQLKNTILRHKMLKAKDRLLLGVSGGPDSLAMLFLFNHLRQSMGLRLYVAHLNHQMRKDAALDLEFVRKACRKLGIPFFGESINSLKLKAKGSLEEVAREIRRDFLIKIAKRNAIPVIALGHTKDDQAETVLMRLLRGSGLSGLSGILPRRNIAGLVFIRPLIEIERKDIDKYLKKIKIKPRIDATNKELCFFRNRIRHKLLPHLANGYSPNIKTLLSNTASILGLDYDYINQQGAQALMKCSRISLQAKRLYLKISLDRLKKLHPAMQRMVLRLGVERLKGDTRRLTFKHWEELEDLFINRKANSIVDLPAGICVKKEPKYLVVSLRKP
ncbi:MAG: tRNA lysidine(34) synthetase TilS [Candidatus Omnitrophota bacterium]|nr:tRNA lysidine(34) synthetase TilS [Candidatus Omnitrophota bacterium]